VAVLSILTICMETIPGLWTQHSHKNCSYSTPGIWWDKEPTNIRLWCFML